MKQVTFMYEGHRYTATKIGYSWRVTKWRNHLVQLSRTPVGKFSTISTTEKGIQRAAKRLIDSKENKLKRLFQCETA